MGLGAFFAALVLCWFAALSRRPAGVPQAAHVASPRPPPGGPFAVQGASDKVGTADGTCACGRLIRSRRARARLSGSGGGHCRALDRAEDRGHGLAPAGGLWGFHRPAGIPRVPPSLRPGRPQQWSSTQGPPSRFVRKVRDVCDRLLSASPAGTRDKKILAEFEFSRLARTICAQNR